MFRFDPYADGYTEPGFVAAEPGRHGNLRFLFRPALVEESMRLRDAALKMHADAFDRQAATFAAVKIVDWDVAGPRNQITAHAVSRLPPSQFTPLFQMIVGWEVSDIDPDWSANTRERTRELERIAAQAGRTPGEVREEQDERNLILGVNLRLFHPAVLQRSCESCQQWMYDDQHRLVRRLGEPVPRPADCPTPCWKCPKHSPTYAAGAERDAARIRATLQLSLNVRATGGRCLNAAQAADSLLVRHLTIVDAIVRRWEARSFQHAANAHAGAPVARHMAQARMR
jgi:hypothetical protein